MNKFIKRCVDSFDVKKPWLFESWVRDGVKPIWEEYYGQRLHNSSEENTNWFLNAIDNYCLLEAFETYEEEIFKICKEKDFFEFFDLNRCNDINDIKWFMLDNAMDTILFDEDSKDE